jgi:hypothetical protein
MFGEQFYPTTRKGIEKMLEPWKSKYGYNLNNKIILEPSAGKGDIVDYITGNYILETNIYSNNPFHTYSEKSVEKKKIYCCEKDPNIKYILQGKDYRVIADDFLEYNGDYFFDLILMNPPFANGDEHLLKAWEVLEEGDIACLLNSETINNPYSSKRKHLMQLIQSYGSVEELGNIFSDAERKTDVNVSLVRLKKVKTKGKFDFEFRGVNKEKSFHIDESTIHDAPALKDIIGNMLIQYDKIKEGFVEYMRIAQQLDHYGAPLVSKTINENTKEEKIEHAISIFSVAQGAFKEGSSKRDAYNIFCDSMKKHMWRIVMTNINNISAFNMEKFMTHSVRQNFSEFSSKQGDMDFTRENVWNMITMLFENKENILEKAISEVFDIFTSYYKENRNYVEGWKTNSKWKVNRKIILPKAVRWGSWSTAAQLKSWGGKFSLHYEKQSQYSDIDKAMDYITGSKRLDSQLDLYESLELTFNQIGNVYPGDTFVNTGESAYFYWKFFKKGTLHIEFKDEKLWEEFNMRACMNKNWLPEYEEKAYRKKKAEAASSFKKEKKQLLLEVEEEIMQL